MDLGLQGDVALVTASSGGLGKAAAAAFGREDAHVVLNGRDEARLEKTAREVREVTSNVVVPQAGDITKRKDVEMLVERTVDEFGTIDHLVTSAGGPPRMRPLEPSDDDWYDAFDLLAMSVVQLVNESTPHLLKDDGGTILNITSLAAKEPVPMNVLSSSVRTAVVNFAKTLSRELAPDVRVNAVLPGSHDSPRVQAGIEQAINRGEYDSYQEAKSSRTDTIPLEELGNPKDFGDTVAFLCSDRASYINGVALPIAGGRSRSIM